MDVLTLLAERRKVTPSGCWEWTGHRQPNGYGAITLHEPGKKPRTVRVHRLSYEAYVGPIPDGMDVDHECENRPCFNPEHLTPKTHAKNMERLRRTHCIRGHELTEDNIYTYRNKRHCRPCRRERNRGRGKK